jgi:hypothetical protein
LLCPGDEKEAADTDNTDASSTDTPFLPRNTLNPSGDREPEATGDAAPALLKRKVSHSGTATDRLMHNGTYYHPEDQKNSALRENLSVSQVVAVQAERGLFGLNF